MFNYKRVAKLEAEVEYQRSLVDERDKINQKLRDLIIRFINTNATPDQFKGFLNYPGAEDGFRFYVEHLEYQEKEQAEQQKIKNIVLGILKRESESKRPAETGS